jgi:hypothetical protein
MVMIGPGSERSLELKAEDLVGTWRLRSWKNVGSDGSEVYPWANGRLATSFRGLLVSELDRQPQVRFVRLEGDLLVLSTKPMIFQGVTRSAELIWERVRRD